MIRVMACQGRAATDADTQVGYSLGLQSPMDRHDAATRSYVMSRIRRENTGPEVLLRQALCSAGARGYRIHARLPGRPDVIFGRARVAVFVDGCFWHGCRKCAIALPRSNRSYWLPKLARNY